MSLRAFQSALAVSLFFNPLPNGDRWIMQRLTNVVHEYYDGWFDVLYRMQARSVFQIKNKYVDTYDVSFQLSV